jgi:hypothetical protein
MSLPTSDQGDDAGMEVLSRRRTYSRMTPASASVVVTVKDISDSALVV